MEALISLKCLTVFSLACVWFTAVGGGREAVGAVRVCKAHVTSEVFAAEVERDAKKAAIQDWTKKAKAAGMAHPSWRVADRKIVKCVAHDGQFECVAHAAPCTIKQKAPPRRPSRTRQGRSGVDA